MSEHPEPTQQEKDDFLAALAPDGPFTLTLQVALRGPNGERERGLYQFGLGACTERADFVRAIEGLKANLPEGFRFATRHEFLRQILEGVEPLGPDFFALPVDNVSGHG